MINIRKAINYPSVVSTLALVVATSGGAYAVTTLPPNSVGTSQLQVQAVTSAKIKTGAVTTPLLQAGAVTGAKIKTGTITNPLLATGSVTSSTVKDGSIGTTDIVPAAITNPLLATGAVDSGSVLDGSLTTSDLADGSVTAGKLADSVKAFSSAWVYASSFTQQTIDNSLVNTGVVSAPEITDAVIKGATINVYMTYGAGYLQLPYTSYAGGKTSTIGYRVSNGQILITRFTADDTASVNLSTVLQYRYVITPSETGPGASNPSAANRRLHSSVG